MCRTTNLIQIFLAYRCKSLNKKLFNDELKIHLKTYDIEVEHFLFTNWHTQRWET